MSYPPVPVYGRYYDASQPQTSAYSSRHTSSNPYAPVTTFANERQSQYHTSGYDLHGQNQTNYGQSGQPYIQQEQYDYGREPANYATQVASGSAHYGGSSSTGRAANLEGLNNLAYASGLDSQTSSRKSQGASAKSSNPQGSINRMQSPMQNLQQQPRYSTTPSGAYSQGSNEQSISPQISVAQALAGAVSRKNQQTAANMQSQAPQRSASPYAAPQNHRRAASSQRQQTASSPNVSKQRAPSVTSGNYQKQSQQSSAGSQSTSISNLVTAEPTAAPETSGQDTMPTYIDPSQVFNPYHREHERRRKEAAEAELRKQQEEVRRKKEEAEKQAEQEAAAKAAAAAAEAAKTKQVQKRSRRKNTPKAKKQPENAPVNDAAPVSAEEDMAAQMKLMMDKMKEFRQQDPGMFQKLWDDMRKGGGNVPTSTGSSAAPATSPQISQQAVAQSPAPINAAQSTPQPGVPSAAGPSGTPASKRKEPKAPPQHPPGVDPSVPLNGWKVIVEDNPQGLPDLGRFPAERRIRGTYQKQAGDKTEKAPRTPAPSGPVPTQPLPARAAGGGVEWPEDKREALAKAAIEALKADKANESIEITTQDINAMLDQNPNYIDLCDLLEKKGLQFHRGQFARQLLASVPDLSKVQKADPPTIVRPPVPPQHMQLPAMAYPQHPMAGPMHGQTPVPGPVPPAAAGFVAGQEPPRMPPPGPLYHGPHIPAPLNHEVKRSHKRKSLPLVKPEPPPGSKEAMARKRNFSELVDLTKLSDNEDYVLSSDHQLPGSPSPEPDLLQQFQMNGAPRQPQAPFQASFVPGPQDSMYSLPQYAAPPPPVPQSSKKPKTVLAKAVNKSEALEKEWYNPKTVARDIMIAAGRHPTERPLNAHMAGLLGVHIELDSDLSTFDWDAIDPGGPPAPRVEYVDIPAGPPRYRLGAKVHKRRERKADEEAPGESRLPDSAKRDAAGDPPAPAPTTSPALFARLNFRKNQRKDDKDQSEARPSRLRESLNYTTERSVTPGKRKASADPQDAPAPHATPGPVSPNPSRPESRASNMDSDGTPSGAVYPSGKRRGRPPGSKNKKSGLTTVRSVAKVAATTPQIQVPASEPSLQAHPVYRCKWKRCKAELHNLETLRKHISKKHHPTDEEMASAQPFQCWWKHCPSLDSEGLYHPTYTSDDLDDWMEHMNQSHVHEVALKLGDGPKTTPVGKQYTNPNKRRKVASSPEDDGHVALTSQSPPSPSASSDARIPSYADAQTLAAAKTRFLSDAKGRSMTPALTPEQNAELPSDTWIITSTAPHKEDKQNTSMDVANGVEVDANIQAQKAFLKTHRQRGERGAIGAKVAAEETLKAMERRKRDVGVGLDRGGCTLVNEARRSTFVQAPGIREEVDADY